MEGVCRRADAWDSMEILHNFGCIHLFVPTIMELISVGKNPCSEVALHNRLYRILLAPICNVIEASMTMTARKTTTMMIQTVVEVEGLRLEVMHAKYPC